MDARLAEKYAIASQYRSGAENLACEILFLVYNMDIF